MVYCILSISVMTFTCALVQWKFCVFSTPGFSWYIWAWHYCWHSVQFSSVTQLCLTLCDPMNHSTPGLPVQLLEFTQTHVHRVGDAIQPSHPLLSPSPPAPIPPSIRVFSNESTLRMRWSKYWSFSFSISPSVEYGGLISFRIDWFWNCLPQIGTWNHVLEPIQNPALYLNPHAWDSDPAKTPPGNQAHMTQTQTLSKPMVPGFRAY